MRARLILAVLISVAQASPSTVAQHVGTPLPRLLTTPPQNLTGDPLGSCLSGSAENGQIGLPDAPLNAAISKAFASIEVSGPLSPPPPPLTISTAPPPERAPRRHLLADEASLAERHRASLKMMDDQIKRLRQVGSAVATLKGLQQKHFQRIATHEMPTWSDLVYPGVGNVCVSALGTPNRGLVGAQRSAAEDLRFASEIAAILVASVDGTVRPVAGSPLAECGPSVEGDWICSPLRPLFASYGYYFVDSQKCALQGLVQGTDGKVTLGCTMWEHVDTPMPALNEVRAFYASLDKGILVVGAAASRFAMARTALATSDDAPSEELHRQLEAERKDLAEWLHELETLKAEISQLDEKISQEERQLALAQHDEKEQITKQHSAELRIEAIDQEYEKHRLVLETIERDLVSAEAAETAIIISCAGANPASCTDKAAKLDYERRRYQARQTVMKARQSRLDEHFAMTDLRTERREEARIMQVARTSLVPIQAGISRIDIVVPQDHKQRDQRTARYSAESPAHASMAADNAADLSVVNELLSLAKSSL